MYILMMTRKTGEHGLFTALLSTHDTEQEARDRMLEEVADWVGNKGFDPGYTNIDRLSAVTTAPDLYDVVRLYVFDSERPFGFDDDTYLDFYGDADVAEPVWGEDL